MTNVDDLALEIAPGELKQVRDCSNVEIVAACLTLLASDSPDDVWQTQFEVLQTVAIAKLSPDAAERSRAGMTTLWRAMEVLPADVRRVAVAQLRQVGAL